MKKTYHIPTLNDLSRNADVLRTSGLFNPQNDAERQALEEYLSGYGVKAGIAKYTK